jgi:glycosyltransferase involved in cell wall biosynthesis
MRILQVVHALPPKAWAGTELVTFHLSQALRARGHEVAIFTRIADPDTEEFSVREEWIDGLEIVQVVNNYTKTSTFRLLYDSPFFNVPFLRLLDRLHPEVVHFQHLQHLSASLLPLAAALGYPTVLSLHDFFFPCHRIQLIDADNRLCPGPERGERCVSCLQEFAGPEDVRHRFTYMEQALQAPDLVLTPSVFLAQKICRYFPFLEEKVRAVPLGVKRIPDVTRERPAGIPLRILYVGVLLPHKGAHVLIEALKGLPLDAIEVSLYGAVASFGQLYADRLREEAQGFPVRFYDAYPHDQCASVLSQHDVLVMPMIWEETFSILTREALMAGLPVVAVRRGALPEVIQDGVNGLLFEPENAADLRRCLARLIAEPGLLERLRHVNPPIKTVDEYARDIEEVYAEVCAEPHRIRTLRHRLATQYQAGTALQQESERLRREIRDLHAQRAVILEERDRLSAEKAATEQECDRALTTVRELENILRAREEQVRERNARLDAIYASTTWKLYRRYAALTHSMRQAVTELWRSVYILRK